MESNLSRQDFKQIWSRYHYGTAHDKELFNQYLRSQLKSQINEVDDRRRRATSLERSRAGAGTSDRTQSTADCHADATANKWPPLGRLGDSTRGRSDERSRLLAGYRDTNKQMMEEKLEKQKQQRRQEIEQDREKAKFFPINWRGTLK